VKTRFPARGPCFAQQTARIGRRAVSFVTIAMIGSMIRLTVLAAGWSILLPAITGSGGPARTDFDVRASFSELQAAVTTFDGSGFASVLSELPEPGPLIGRFFNQAD
jgi:hypothetical protein